jgi:hypothetical protein
MMCRSSHQRRSTGSSIGGGRQLRDRRHDFKCADSSLQQTYRMVKTTQINAGGSGVERRLWRRARVAAQIDLHGQWI